MNLESLLNTLVGYYDLKIVHAGKTIVDVILTTFDEISLQNKLSIIEDYGNLKVMCTRALPNETWYNPIKLEIYVK